MLKFVLALALSLSLGCTRKTVEVKLLSSQSGGSPSQAIHAISPYIYGFGTSLTEDREEEKVFELRPSIQRFGGNSSSRFNYQNNSYNTSHDWFFTNYTLPLGNGVEQFMKQNREKGMASVITISMLGWVAKDGTSSSFTKQKFPKQDAFDKDAGNGQLDGKSFKADPRDTSIPITPEFVSGWVSKLKSQFGDHPHFYIMDNEPMLWNETHRDVQQEPMTYDGYLQKYIAFATAVRQADPDAVIVGPAAWGWMEMQYSAFDKEGPWSKGKFGTDRAKHGDVPFLEWFLGELVKVEARNKISLLDILDVHYYPTMEGWGEEGSKGFRRKLLRSTRSLWDRDYTDESWINEKIYLIPRLKELVARFKPSAKVSIGEYNFRGERDQAGAIAQADILGIMAGEDLYSAFYWDFPFRDGTHRNAFLLYRNFDGKGAQFGNTWMPNSIGNKTEHSVYTASDAGAKRVTVMILNKSLTAEQKFKINFQALGAPKSARIAGFNSGEKYGEMERFMNVIGDLDKLEISTKPLSMQIVELNY